MTGIIRSEGEEPPIRRLLVIGVGSIDAAHIIRPREGARYGITVFGLCHERKRVA